MLGTAVVLVVAIARAAAGPVAVVGGDASADASAVALDSSAGPCSGVVVAPRVVLTAAHCLGADGVVHVGAAAPWVETVAIVASHRHRAWRPGASAYDLALVRLASAVTAPPRAPRATDAATLTAVEVIGYGRRRADDPASLGVRTAATLTIVDRDAALLYTAATGPAFTCAGDSGAPALDVDGAIAALVVAGDAGCAGPSRLARVDRERAWIAEVVAAWDGPCAADGACGAGCARDPDCEPCALDGACHAGCAAPDLDCPLGPGPGASCADDLACESRRCVVAPDDPTTRYCSAPCGVASDCPGPFDACVAQACGYAGPTPGRLGSPCAADATCASGICDRGLAVCAVACGVDDACPATQACASTGQGPLCRPASGGCALGGGGGGGLLALALALGLALRARRSFRSSTGRRAGRLASRVGAPRGHDPAGEGVATRPLQLRARAASAARAARRRSRTAPRRRRG